MTGNNIADKITSISKKSPVHSNNGISKKIANLLDKTSNQKSKFRTKNWVESSDESRGTYSVIDKLILKN